MHTIDCLTECSKCKVSFVKPYKLDDIYLLDSYKRYDSSICGDCLSSNKTIPPIKAAMDIYHQNVDSGYKSLLAITRTLKNFWGMS